MFKLVNVSLDYGRLKDNPRTRMTDSDRPIFSWGALNGRKNARQQACRLKTAAWDSGWVITAEQRLRYGGSPPPKGEPVDFELQIRDDAGYESEIYKNTFYNANIEWRAGWIGAANDERGKTLYLRKDINISAPVASATLYACGIGYHEISLNGAKIDNAALDPAHTDYSKTCQYVMYPEFEKLLRPGANCLGVMVGEGWRRNGIVAGGAGAFAGLPAFTGMLRICYQNGGDEWIYTDETWQCGRGAHSENDIFNGELYDANKSASGWNKPGFMGFPPAKALPAPGGVMRPMLIPPILEHKTHQPIACWPAGEDAAIVDFGRNIAGVIRMRLPKDMGRGRTIRVFHAETLDEDGMLYTAPLRGAKATDTYIASGDACDLDIWQPIFTYHGFRYVRVEGIGAGFDPALIEAVELYTDLDTRSSFRCGSALAAKIHENCIATERSNQHGVLTDCPQRDERQGWMNDATVRFEETPYNFEVGRMFPKIIRDIIDAQGADGSITCTAPFVWGSRPADPVCSSFLAAAAQACLHTGNLEIIREGYENFKAWAQCLLDNSTGYIVNYSYYGDWAGPAYACEGEDGAVSAVTPGVFMSTGYSYLNCRLISQFAGLLGKADEQALWADTAEKVKNAMLGKWYNAVEAKMATGSHACQAFTLWLDIAPEADASRMAKRLRDDLAAAGYQFTTGNLCTRYLMDVLARYGYIEDAWKIITKETYPSFGFMVQHEATTIWERFELKKNPGMNSWNHPMYGAVDYWLYAYLCGIKPVKPAWDEVIIEPFMPKDLLSAEAVVDTVKGELAVRWVKRYGYTYLYVTVPFGVGAKVVFDGKTAAVGSGFHVFSAQL